MPGLQIECCIDEWITGIKTDIPFSTALYKDVYEDHIRCLERFNKITKQLILPNILVKLYNRGRYVSITLFIKLANHWKWSADSMLAHSQFRVPARLPFRIQHSMLP